MTRLLQTILCLVFLGYSLNISAKIIDNNAAEKVAKNLISERAGSTSMQITSTDLITVQGLPVIYIFHLNNNMGFVLVSADDRVFPVLGYSFEDGFKTSDMPENVNFWLNSYKKQITEAVSMNLNADAAAVEAWDHYSADNFAPADNITAVSPLITSKWDQGCNYNALCPVAAGGDCNRAWVGCVATAMGMVMKYHSYPAQGTGSHSYTHATYGVQSANFGSTTYNYASMPTQLYGSNTATATLLYHCGVSVDMDYGVSGSGAQTANARNALVNYFNYSSGTYYAQKFWYTDAAWEDMIRTDLGNSLPIIYSGTDASYGHCFILDGYQGTNFFHFNWGWSGWNNGYFYLTNLNSGNGVFNLYQQAIFHIAPPMAPVAQFTSNTQNSCTANQVNFTNQSTGAPTSYSWSFPGGTPSVSNVANPVIKYYNAGSYDVKLKVTNALGTDSITKTSWITVAESPVKPLPVDTTICCNNTIQLDAANTGSTYNWNTGATTQTITVDSSNTGIGTKMVIVQVTGANTCITKDTINITFAACTGMNELGSITDKLWPNPSTGLVFIESNLIIDNNTDIMIYSFDGRIIRGIQSNYPGDDIMEADLSGLPERIYMIRIDNGKESRIFKANLIK